MRKTLLLLAACAICMSPWVMAYADDAIVLPKNTWSLKIDGSFSLPIDRRFDTHGHEVDLAKDFNTELDSTVFTSLAPLNAFVGGNASIGHSIVSMTRYVQKVVIQPAYGITDKLSIGVNIPYWWVKQTINARVDPSSANVGKNPAFACGAPICPLAVPGTTPLTTDDVQNLLGGGLNVGGVLIPGLGFKRFESWHGEGVGDIDAGFKYQYYTGEKWRMAFTGALEFPTGRVDDPNNLGDYGWGNGTYSLIAVFNQDYVMQPEGAGRRLGVPDPGTFFINTTLRYQYFFPDTQTLRVCSIETPVCPDIDNVRRKLGDIIEGELSARIGLFFRGLTISPLYRYSHQFQGHFAGDHPGFDYGSLAVESEGTAQYYQVSLGYSTIPRFAEGTFPIPLSASVYYNERFAGDNHFTKTRFFGLILQAYF